MTAAQPKPPLTTQGVARGGYGGLRRIRTALQIWNARLIYRSHSNAVIYKFGCTVTGGAYHSARKVAMCACSGYKSGACLNYTRSTHQPRPSTLFSPIFSLAREKIGPPEACWKRFAGLCFEMGMPDPEKTYFDRQTGHSQWPRPVFCIIPSGSRIHSLPSWGIYCDHTQCGSSRNSPGWRT